MYDDYIGQRFGNYQLLRVLGKGSFATVYLAEHQYLDVPAAIKLLHVQMDTRAYERFLREARTIARVQYPHIVRVMDFGIENEVPYLIMEHMPGGTLGKLYPRGTRVPLDQIVTYVKQIAPALDYAHQQRVIHRDIKPDNILLNAHNEAVISDFGIAIVQQTIASSSLLKLAGTPIYMAPEQIDLRPCPASDQYALGVLVYEWLAGEPPFRGSTIFEIWSQHMHQPPPSLRERVPQLPGAVEDAVFGALAKDPRDRFATTQDFAMVLEEACFATLPQLFSISNAPAILATQRIENRSIVAPWPALPAPSMQSRAEVVALPTPRSTLQNQSIAKQFKSSTARINRQRLLNRVRSFWIEGVLQHSLHGAALIALGLQEQADAVANPWSLALQPHNALARPIPGGTHISQVYDAANGELLILGAPGSGKTTLLLELARDLLKRAEQDEAHPMPVVFNLSSWALKQQALTDWLVDELLNKYQVPRKIGHALVDAEQILPLLDGLDEVAAKERTACIEAINSYRQEHGLLPMVVCSRRADYLDLATRIHLDSAVVVEPLTEQQIDSYLKGGGAPLRTLRLALHQNSELRDLAHTPLMLSILTLTYHGMPVEHLLYTTNPEILQRRVFERYVERMLAHKRLTSKYTPQQTIHWLSSLARQLVQRKQTVFYIERMQPDWLEGSWALQRYPRAAAGLVFGLLGAICLGPFCGLLFGQLMNIATSSVAIFLGLSLLCMLLCGSVFGLVNMLFYGRERRLPEGVRWSWRRVGRRLVRSAINGCLVGLLVGLPLGLDIKQPGDIFVHIFTEAGIFGLLGGLAFVLIDGFLGIQMAEIRPAETFVWSWAQMGRSLVKFLLLGLLGSQIIALLLGLLEGLIVYMRSGSGLLILAATREVWWAFTLAFGPAFALLSGLLGALAGGLAGDMLDARNLITPNQGIRRSARHSIVIGCIGLVVGGIIFGVLGGLGSDSIVGLKYGIVCGLLIGLISGLRAGGVACIQHLVLRWLQWETGSVPWKYARFLDYATEHVLLRKVGGGYIFVHRMLLEYFASLEDLPRL